jgi:hypothetical protein
LDKEQSSRAAVLGVWRALPIFDSAVDIEYRLIVPGWIACFARKVVPVVLVPARPSHCIIGRPARVAEGALLTGDIIQVVLDRRYISFMRSYPSLIPLGAPSIRRILERIEPFQFEQIYGAWLGAKCSL